MSDDLKGQVLADRYEVRTQHAEEMLGRVYLAKDRSTGALVHIKVLHPYLTQNPEKVRRFAREVTATSAVRHPNSVATLDHGETGELHWLVLEYFPARSLQEEVEQNGPLDAKRAVHIAAQIASALAAAHKEGVVHRNMNPGNILLLKNARRDDYVKVRDFGLSRLEGGEEDDAGGALTTAGARIGNTFYMAPEYIEEQVVDPRGDVYALGGILMFMLTGHPPFQGRPGQVLEMHLHERPRAVSLSRSDIPPWLDEMILVLLGKDPRKRPTSASVVEMLNRNAGRDLAPPPLLAVDAEGNAIAPTVAEKAAESVIGRTAVIGGSVAVLGIGFVVLAVVAFAVVAFLMSR